jgi:hypothetical protein
MPEMAIAYEDFLLHRLYLIRRSIVKRSGTRPLFDLCHSRKKYPYIN